MEDRIVMKCPLNVRDIDEEIDEDDDESDHWSLFGVLDGHGGEFSSDFVGRKLPDIVANSLREAEKTVKICSIDVVKTLELAIREACLNAEAELSEQDRMKVTGRYGLKGRKETELEPFTELLSRDVSGTTLCFCAIGHEYVVIANVGDSRAVLGTYRPVKIDMAYKTESKKEVVAVPLSEDHKFTIPTERIRATNAGFG